MPIHLCQHYLGLTGTAEQGLWPITLSYIVRLTKIRRMEIYVHMVEKSRIKHSVSQELLFRVLYHFLILTECLSNICGILLYRCEKYCEMASQTNEKELAEKDEA